MFQVLGIVFLTAVGLATVVLYFLKPALYSPSNVEAVNRPLDAWQSQLTYARNFNEAPTGSFDGVFAGYVGSDACKKCHAKQHASYLQTSHSRSFSETSRSHDPAEGEYDHLVSSRNYRAYHDGEVLRHAETMRSQAGETVAVTDIPMKYAVGSGEHAKSYLYESEGFFFQSPLAWYAEVNGWRMSPGYDRVNHKSFTRVITDECLFCHVGMIQRATDHAIKFRVVEHAIGCERCHGPGNSHIAFHAGNGTDAIIHPHKLSREKSEAICQQCHLQAWVSVTAPDTDPWDLRPGQSLIENRSDYQIDGHDEFKLVGHVEQLHQSKCYIESDTLTCITCHEPHHSVPEKERVDYHRNACLACHTSQACGVELKDREVANQNACASCHMPKLPTNVTPCRIASSSNWNP